MKKKEVSAEQIIAKLRETWYCSAKGTTQGNV